MEASDMLDVVHYFLDEDMRYSSVEELKIHDSVRKNIFKTFYDTEYRYGIPGDTPDSVDSDAIKPYIPPTEVNPDAPNPFGAVLDAPIG